MKTLISKKLPKNDREQAVLFGLIELYIKSGKPIGSQTLQENGFESLSSATIRNYLAKLEELGYLLQPHTSGGRVPTAQAFRAYADHFYDKGTLDSTQGECLEEAFLQSAFGKQHREISTLIHRASEVLSHLSKCAVFISMPRFDQDFTQEIRLLALDSLRVLAVVITDFGTIRTETIFTEQEVDEAFLKQCERYFLWRLNKGESISFETESHLKMAQRLYNEIMVRHVVGYLHFPAEDILRCGMSRLLAYPEFNDAAAMVNSLSLLENEEEMRLFLRKASQSPSLTCWIGDELCPHVMPDSGNAAIAIPYYINQMPAGSVALLGPMRLPYPKLFGLMRHFSELLTKALTEAVYKFKITFRQPTYVGDLELLKANQSILLEDQTDKP